MRPSSRWRMAQLGGGAPNVTVEIINQTGQPIVSDTQQITGPDGQKGWRE